MDLFKRCAFIKQDTIRVTFVPPIAFRTFRAIRFVKGHADDSLLSLLFFFLFDALPL